jgi:L-asparaginase/Glu-tRNA(Gln) amidotransferase subunit D
MGTDHVEGAAAVLDPRTVVKSRTHGDGAFSSIGSPTFGYVQDAAVTITSYPAPVLESTPSVVESREVSDKSVLSAFDTAVDIVKISPFTDPDRLQRILAGLRGVVIEGYGAGHVPKSHLDVMREFAGPVVLTTQVITDAERLGSYASDRAILQLPNVIPGGATTSTTALVTLSWALGNGQDPFAQFVRRTCEPASNPH